MPPSTRPSSSQSSIHQHPKLHAPHAPQHPAVKLAKQHPPAPQTACPLAPGRQACKAASTSTSNCMPPSTRPSSSQSSIHQHLKLHAPQRPAVKLAKQHPPAPQTACPLAPGRQARKAAPTSTPNCMPPSTRPSKQHPPAPQTACPLAPGRQARKAASTSTPNCMPPMPPSTRPSSSQSSTHQHPKLHAP